MGPPARMGAPPKAWGGTHRRARGRRAGSNAHTAGSRCGKGVGVVHIEFFAEGREHRHTQAGEGVVGLNLRGGQPQARMGTAFKGRGDT
eukprot:scaffold14902_cov83-Isochrysis_galbana.AAC.1